MSPGPLTPYGFFAAVALPDAVRWCGVATIWICVLGLIWVSLALGKNFNGSVRVRRDHELVTHGPYRWVRHPMYSLTNIFVIGLGVASANAFVLVVGLTTYCTVAMLRIKREEAMMLAHFGKDYEAYMSEVGCLLPKFNPRRSVA